MRRQIDDITLELASYATSNYVILPGIICWAQLLDIIDERPSSRITIDARKDEKRASDR